MAMWIVEQCRTCDHDVTGSNLTLGCCVSTPSKRAIPPGSVNEYSKSWGVNGHTTRCSGPLSVVLHFLLVSG